MRVAGSVFAVTLLVMVPASAQPHVWGSDPYGLDPYNPSDAVLLREYGAALVAQTPLLELRTLDPYMPSHAALLRQIGGAIPWNFVWYPAAPRLCVCGRSCTRIDIALSAYNAASVGTPLTDDSVSGSARRAKVRSRGNVSKITANVCPEGR